jgi:uncharacterized protein
VIAQELALRALEFVVLTPSLLLRRITCKPSSVPLGKFRPGARILPALIGALIFSTGGLWAAEYRVKVENNVSTPMRDGVVLKADIYRPEGKGPFPVLLARTPYGKQNSASTGKNMAKRGYIVVIQDVRGRGQSAGVFDPFFEGEKDGYDTVEWAAKLLGSDGKVGMFGGSYGGGTQVDAALASPPHLVTIFAVFPSIAFQSHQIVFEGGEFRQLLAESWSASQTPEIYSRTIGELASNGPLFEKLMMKLPVANFMEALFEQSLMNGGGGYFRQWVRHAPGSPYWERVDVARRVSQLRIPGCYVEGWYDIFGPQTIGLFPALQKDAGTELARSKSQLIVGPWTHGGPGFPSGEVNFGKDAKFKIGAYQDQWFDYWLKGEANQVPAEPPVRLFVMGDNRWEKSSTWPIPGEETRGLYLSASTSAVSLKGDGLLSFADSVRSHHENDILLADPEHPVATRGGKLCCDLAFLPGAYDQRPTEKRQDVLVYSTPPLTQPLTVIGNPSLIAFVSSDRPSADLIVKLVDVSPDGKAINVADGALRLSYRNGFAKAEHLSPGKIYEVNIDLGPTANTFLPGHRIRLQIAGTEFPTYARNLNSGEGLAMGTHPLVSHSKIWYGKNHPSRLVLNTKTGMSQ